MRIERACKLGEPLLIENPADVFYLTGLWFSAARLLLKPDKAVLLVDGRYFGQAQGKVPCEVVLAEKEALAKAVKGLKRVRFDSSFVTVEKAQLLAKSAPNVEWFPVSRPLKELRAVKDEEELGKLKAAARTTAEGYRHIAKRLEEGVVEEEIALEFEVFCRKKGASKLSFEPIIAFGENSAYPHYRAGKSRLKKNQAALCDLGAVVDGYRGDMTRVYFHGEPPEESKRFYALVKQAHDLAFEKARPGIKAGELDAIVRAFFEKEGVAKLFTHSLGHGVGVDVHEYPLLRFDGDDRDAALEPGMVFTIEPGLYLPGVGGARYENTVAMTEDGLENFYAGV